MRPRRLFVACALGSMGCASVNGPCTLDAKFGTEDPGVRIECQPGGSASMVTPSRTLQVVEAMEADALLLVQPAKKKAP